MNKILAPLCLFALCASLFMAVGGASAMPPKNLVGSATLVDMIDGSWYIMPGLYTYKHFGQELIIVYLTNNADYTHEFDMGDGNVITVPARASIQYGYNFMLRGQTERIEITELSST